MYRPEYSEYYVHIVFELRYGGYFHSGVYDVLRPEFDRTYYTALAIL